VPEVGISTKSPCSESKEKRSRRPYNKRKREIGEQEVERKKRGVAQPGTVSQKRKVNASADSRWERGEAKQASNKNGPAASNSSYV